MAMPTRTAAIETSRTASPTASAKRVREPAVKGTARAAAKAITIPATRSAVVVARMRRHPSPISARSLVRIAATIEDVVNAAAARAGAAASTHSTPNTASVGADA